MKIPLPFLFAFLLALLPGTTNSQLFPRPPPRPLCSSQLALVNYACGSVQLTPMPPASSTLPSPPMPRVNRHRRRHEEMPQEEQCCRWLKEVDPVCVCELLVYLPTFLSRPNHIYTVVVHDTCSVTYGCGGVIRL